MNGLLLLDKPLGLSSNRAMQQVKRLFNCKKAGHTGSLDPLATGMLPICLGEATKFAQYLLDANKSYRVTGCLGVQTSTGDAEGEIIKQQPVPDYTQEQILSAVHSFLGVSLQTPPMFSALKHKGQPFYRYALQGIDIERQARSIEIFNISLLSYQHPHFSIEVTCSKGTYMRSLIEDIAHKLDNCAYITQLHRVSTFGFDESQMVAMSVLENLELSDRQQLVLPMDVMVSQFPKFSITKQQTLSLQQGKVIPVSELSELPKEQINRLYDDNFVGLGEYSHDKGLFVKRLCQY